MRLRVPVRCVPVRRTVPVRRVSVRPTASVRFGSVLQPDSVRVRSVAPVAPVLLLPVVPLPVLLPGALLPVVLLFGVRFVPVAFGAAGFSGSVYGSLRLGAVARSRSVQLAASIRSGSVAFGCVRFDSFIIMLLLGLLGLLQGLPLLFRCAAPVLRSPFSVLRSLLLLLPLPLRIIRAGCSLSSLFLDGIPHGAAARPGGWGSAPDVGGRNPRAAPARVL